MTQRMKDLLAVAQKISNLRSEIVCYDRVLNNNPDLPDQAKEVYVTKVLAAVDKLEELLGGGI